MNRMTDERQAEIESGRSGVGLDDLVLEIFAALKAERTKVAEDLEAACKAVMQAGIATGHADNVLMLVDHILEQHEETRTALAESKARARELEGWIDRYCGQPDQTVVFNQFKAIQGNAEAAEAQLAALRERLEGLVNKWCGILPEGEGKPPNWFGNKLKPLITQSRPTVNSVDGVNAGENSGGGG